MNIFTYDLPEWAGMTIAAVLLAAMLYFRYSTGV